mmetsp:Transcript_57577/g.108338  ORF Transcript_57577/g.108338 Transcript_57577/m.108338 type:complete len:125 (+) Transcript_57577:323-697(+)
MSLALRLRCTRCQAAMDNGRSVEFWTSSKSVRLLLRALWREDVWIPLPLTVVLRMAGETERDSADLVKRGLAAVGGQPTASAVLRVGAGLRRAAVFGVGESGSDETHLPEDGETRILHSKASGL